MLRAMPVTYHLRISGRVQGVYFRRYMQDEAQRLGVSGWVRNRTDGTVEAVAHGEKEAVERLVEWARKGPPSARVTDVQVSAGSGEYSGFEMRRTE
jgi:acylphosphatase